jgi:ribulose bisphosphate carboxylase small subunit
VGTINYSQAIKPDTAYIKKIIENSLLSDWSICIEFLSRDAKTTDWQLWDKAFFALRSAKPVMTALLDCYEKNSSCAIRIVAEKFRPQTRLLYTVYSPHILPEERVLEPQTINRESVREIDPPYVQTRMLST